MNSYLPWPPEAARYPHDAVRPFSAPGSNRVLDFHGDPAAAGLAVFSDGNHHMALEASVQAFLRDYPEVGDVFYTTTPPAPLVDALKGDGLAIGNLRINRKPDVFIGPQDILQGLSDEGLLTHHRAFAESRGNVLLVRNGNPKRITSVADLLSDDVILACSNPITETASFTVYRDAASHFARRAGVDGDAIVARLSVTGPGTVHSQIIHHREIPELIAAGQADAAIIYYHLALRYSRIFPDLFAMVDPDGVATAKAGPGNPRTRYHIGAVGDGGRWGEAFISFMLGDTAQRLYEEHGLARMSHAG